MSTKLTSFIVGVVGLFAFAVGTMQGCGSSSSGNSNVATCNKICDKVQMCTPDAGSADLMQCQQACASQAANLHCSNEAAITSAINNCVAMSDCIAALACLGTVPDCQMTTGTGGTTGGGGTTGNGGAGGSGTAAWTCTETAQGCACGQTSGGAQTTCTATYDCCFTVTSGGTNTCSCGNAGTSCNQVVAAIAGAEHAADCPP